MRRHFINLYILAFLLASFASLHASTLLSRFDNSSGWFPWAWTYKNVNSSIYYYLGAYGSIPPSGNNSLNITSYTLRTPPAGSIYCGIGSSGPSSYDFNPYYGVKLYVKGSGQPIKIELASDNITDDGDYSYTISATPPEWTLFFIPYMCMAQPSWAVVVPRTTAFSSVKNIKFSSTTGISGESGWYCISDVSNIDPGVSNSIAPAKIINLTLKALKVNSSFKLEWTAPGGDGVGGGRAVSYDIRYSDSYSTLTNWISAVPISSPPSPADPGTKESLSVFGLDVSIKYYFAVKSIDNDANVSPLSVVASNEGVSDTALLIDNFEDGNTQSKIGTYWYFYDDKPDSGNSSTNSTSFITSGSPGSPLHSAFFNYTMRATPRLSAPYVAMGLNINPDYQDFYSIGSGISFYIKGSNTSIRVRLKTSDVDDNDYFGYTFIPSPYWTKYTIPYNSLYQEGYGNKKNIFDSLSQVTAVDFKTSSRKDGETGSVWLDDLRLVTSGIPLRLVINADKTGINPGEQLQLTATGYDQDNFPYPPYFFGGIEWSVPGYPDAVTTNGLFVKSETGTYSVQAKTKNFSLIGIKQIDVLGSRIQELGFTAGPNLFIPGKTDKVSFRFILDRTEEYLYLTLYTSRGIKVKDLISNKKYAAGYYLQEWDGKDNKGDTLASGVYTAVLKGKTLDKQAKIMVVR